MKYTRLAASITGIATALYLSGCATRAETRVAVRPVSYPQQAVAVVPGPPAPRPTVAARPVIIENVVPEANDIYISAAANGDVVFVGGSTYIWARGPDGQRHRHFYGHGDRREEVFRRRENLRSVVSRRSGHPPAKHVEHGPRHSPEDIRHAQQLHARSTPDQAHLPRHRLAADNQSRHTGSHYQSGSNQNLSPREATAGPKGLEHRAEPRVYSAKAELPPKSWPGAVR